MTGPIDRRLEELGIEIPQAHPPIAARIEGWALHNDLLFISGAVPKLNGEPQYIGKAGREFDRDGGIHRIAIQKKFPFIPKTVGKPIGSHQDDRFGDIHRLGKRPVDGAAGPKGLHETLHTGTVRARARFHPICQPDGIEDRVRFAFHAPWIKIPLDFGRDVFNGNLHRSGQILNEQNRAGGERADQRLDGIHFLVGSVNQWGRIKPVLTTPNLTHRLSGTDEP